MAIATAYTPVNLDANNITSGTVTIATSTHLQFVSGNQVQDWFGSGFTFDSNGFTGGTITSVRSMLDGVVQYELTGMNHSPVVIQSYARANDPQGLNAYLFNGNDTFNGSSGNDIANGYDGNDVIFGNNGNDVLRGNQGNDTLIGGPGNDTLDGGGGADTVVLSGPLANYTASGQGSGLQIVDLTGADGTDFVTGIERYDLADVNLAFDLGAGQAAGNTVRVIGAAFDAPTIQQHPDYVGIGLSLFDSGMSMLAVCQLVIGVLGNPSNEAFVNTVYQNLVGAPPSQAELNYYVGLLVGSGGGMTQAQLLEIAANAPVNELNIDLVGLQSSGVEFV